MFRRRRRRRSAFARRPAIPLERRWVLAAAGGVILIALFAFFIHQADTHKPPTHEISVDLPNAFKD
jgi:hypothetical protein